MPRVIPIAEKTIIVPKRSYARTIRPHQWHITKGGHTVEKEFREGVGLVLT